MFVSDCKSQISQGLGRNIVWLQTMELQYGEDASPLQPRLSIKIRSFNTLRK